jgi:hypothetical protein
VAANTSGRAIATTDAHWPIWPPSIVYTSPVACTVTISDAMLKSVR